MGEKEKVTIMVLKVDLQCHKCYKKVKKVLCKFPEIRDQIYDEKQNQVVIKVVSPDPEKIRDKIYYKGGCAIQSIEIKEPEKPKPPPKEPEKPKPPPPEKPKPPPEPEKPKPPQEPEKPKPPPPIHPFPCWPVYPVPCVPVCPPPIRPPFPCVPVCPPPIRPCCTECSQGHAGGPCHSGSGGWPAPCIQYDGYYGRPVYDSYGSGCENPSACTVM